MSELKFEWKNLIKSKILILGMIIALLFSGINYAYNALNQHLTYYRLFEEYGNYNNRLNEEAETAYRVLKVKGMTREELAQKMSAFYDAYEEYYSQPKPVFMLNTIEDQQKAMLIKTISGLDLPYEDYNLSLNGAKFTEIVSRRFNGVPLILLTILLGSFIVGHTGTKNDYLRNTLPIKSWQRYLSKVIMRLRKKVCKY